LEASIMGISFQPCEIAVFFGTIAVVNYIVLSCVEQSTKLASSKKKDKTNLLSKLQHKMNSI
jgi:hypothetical protein